MAKNILKAWLVDNTVTTEDTTDKIFQLESARTADLTYIIDRMVAKNPGVLRGTMEMIVKLHNDVVAEEVLNGVSVNTGLFRAVAQFRGTAVNDAWDPEKDSVYVSFTQGKTLRENISNTTVEVLGERPVKFYIGTTSDVATKATDYSATAGRNLTVYGKNILPEGDDPSVGVTFTDAEGEVTTLDLEDITINKPSELTLLLPATLANGEYTLTVTTQFSRGANQLLKTPRSVSTTIYVGGKPEDSDDEERPGGL